jgi:ABC-2 type transport system ATP-binding protein
MNDSILSVDGAVKRFGDRVALDRLDLTLGAGDVYALLGPNGAGKTTTINLALGFLRADEGSVQVCGVDCGARRLRALEHIAYIPEQVALYPDMSARENVAYFTTLAGLCLTDQAIERALAEAGLPAETHDRNVKGFSKGMRQKIAIALAVARNARLLLLDEPTSGLDPSAATQLTTLIRATATKGAAVLMATHDLYRVREVANRVGILRAGKLAREVDPASFDPAGLNRLYTEVLAA